MRKLMACLVALAATAAANAVPITVSSYDIDRGRASGFGGWSHTYSGTVTPNGDGTSQFTGGSGTINDGITPTSHINSHLYWLADNSITTLFLGSGLYNVSTVDLLGFNTGNTIPGNINTVEVTINGISATFSTTGFGPNNSSTGVPIHDRIDLTGSILDGLATNQIEIRVLTLNFTGTSDQARYYQIGEAQVSGAAATTPEPVSLLVFGGLLVGGGLVARKRLTKKVVA